MGKRAKKQKHNYKRGRCHKCGISTTLYPIWSIRETRFYMLCIKCIKEIDIK